MIPVKTFCVTSLLMTSDLVLAAESTLLSSAEKISESKELAGSGFSDPNVAGNLIQTTLGLLVVLLVIAAAAWAFKRFGHFQSGLQGQLKVVGGVSLGSRERVVLLQVGSQQLVLGVAPGRIQTLHVLDEPLSMESNDTQGASFSERLQSAMASRVNAKTDKSSDRSSTS